jgi:gamma-D-glutamyl-L-lysine dipeptidyl-peptidase
MPVLTAKKRLGLTSLALGVAGLVAVLIAGCSTADGPANGTIPESLRDAVHDVTNKFAPDGHMAICRIPAVREGGHFVLRGDVENPAARDAAMAAAKRAGLDVRNQIDVLPDQYLGDRLWGIATLSVVNVRENPNNAAEMGTQMLTGECFKVWKYQSNWFLIQTADGYVGWTENGGFANGTRADVNRWNAAPHLIVTNYEERILERPDPAAMPISDVVMGSQVKCDGESGDWFKVELADGRCGFLPKSSATDYSQWKAARHPTPENIEHTARLFLGRPYSWGCNSIRGLDCSGLTKFVFFLNGIELRRNASEQCRQGTEVPLDDGLNNLRKGDLLFFGRRARRGQPEWIFHTGIYLGDGLFIQPAERVRISSLDSDSPLRDPRRIRTLLHARRLLAGP